MASQGYKNKSKAIAGGAAKNCGPHYYNKKKKIYVQIQYGQKAHGRDVFTKEKPQKHNISAEWC